jgi:hypothetical protein
VQSVFEFRGVEQPLQMGDGESGKTVMREPMPHTAGHEPSEEYLHCVKGILSSERDNCDSLAMELMEVVVVVMHGYDFFRVVVFPNIVFLGILNVGRCCISSVLVDMKSNLR